MATSSGQGDSGMFELNFRDDRYLWFEYRGAVSCWRIEIPPENNYFDLDTLSDLILKLNYTAREGGDLLRREASEVARRHVPGDGWCFFDVRHEFPDAWELLRDSFGGRRPARELKIRLRRDLFPFIPGGRELRINAVALVFETRESDSQVCHVVEFNGREEHRAAPDERHRCEAAEIRCVASAEWPGLYCGVTSASLEPLGRDCDPIHAVFRFPGDSEPISRAFLFFGYAVARETHPGETGRDRGRMLSDLDLGPQRRVNMGPDRRRD